MDTAYRTPFDGRSLTAPRSGRGYPRPVQRTWPCPECGDDIGSDTCRCPGCGYVDDDE